MTNSNIFVRFAPSPTGLLHIGNIRAILFNYLFARKHGGRFLLRIDDTDQERSRDEYEQAIRRDLTWLGYKWDEEARQSSRMDRYMAVIEELKSKGRVYPCFETQAELDLKRKTQLGRGLPPVYDRAALKLTPAEIQAKLDKGESPHWRFKLLDGEITWEDGIQGAKKFPASSMSDPVLIREDGVPLYSICSVIDDADMGITHVVRGEDHVTNTATQIQMWQAVTDKPVPQFAHFPLLVSLDGTEMSKRLGTLSIGSMRDDDKIEPMAINSLIARLGTSDPITPCLDMNELAAGFDFSKISRATPKFDLNELKQLSTKILRMTPYAQIKDRLGDEISEEFWNAVQPNINSLEDVDLWWKVTNGPVELVREEETFLNQAADLLPAEPWDETTWQTWTDAVKEKTGRKGKALFMPLRLALTGTDHGPELKLLLPLIGRERVLRRLRG
jgi:glutamyl-tRNA synthetase